jgi:hypothetical protein
MYFFSDGRKQLNKHFQTRRLSRWKQRNSLSLIKSIARVDLNGLSQQQFFSTSVVNSFSAKTVSSVNKRNPQTDLPSFLTRQRHERFITADLLTKSTEIVNGKILRLLTSMEQNN